MEISADLIRGHIDTIILKMLLAEDRYGYQICKTIHVASEGGYELKEATMYSSLKRLEGDGCIVCYWGDESQGGRRKYYKITERGKSVYAQNTQDWEHAKRMLEKLL